MTDKITIIPYGSLRSDTGAALSDKLTRPIAHRQPLAQFLEAIGISVSRIQLAMINHRTAGLDTMVGAGDRVALFPREYPIFVDWHAFRHASAQPAMAVG
jgi:molybdopterin converting factor small subunit